ncbi:hypothetical protein AALO_G00282400 [Alosa alosa]|uniref:Uncharacterized protein n=1 Tax=Alosa alosa TaxID=278164 RepID=A0AAV6FMR5_9TELE|nr:hypothetical protein AALO_G00282400 [Alosa alosa]
MPGRDWREGGMAEMPGSGRLHYQRGRGMPASSPPPSPSNNACATQRCATAHKTMLLNDDEPKNIGTLVKAQLNLFLNITAK